MVASVLHADMSTIQWWALIFYVLGIGSITGCAALTVKRIWEALEAVAFYLDSAAGKGLDDGH